MDQVEAEFFAQENLEELRSEFHRNIKDNNASLYFCFNYITTVLSRCRSKNGHIESPKHRQVEEDYLVRAAACMRFNKWADAGSMQYVAEHSVLTSLTGHRVPPLMEANMMEANMMEASLMEASLAEIFIRRLFWSLMWLYLSLIKDVERFSVCKPTGLG